MGRSIVILIFTRERNATAITSLLNSLGDFLIALIIPGITANPVK